MLFSLLQCLLCCVALISQLCNSQSCTTQKSKSCIFPFEYQNKIYNGCNQEKVKPGRSWCSIKVDGRGEHVKGKKGITWDLCSPDCHVDTDPETTCKETSQCVNTDDCPQYQTFKNIPKRNRPSDYQTQRKKWIDSICNKKEKKLCCPSQVPEYCKQSQEFPGNYLPTSGQCGKNCITDVRVSGGVNARLGEYPWAALLGYKVRKKVFDYKCGCQKTEVITKYRCGGTLINNRYVLTAAHCHEGRNRVSSVVLGEWEVEKEIDCPNGIEPPSKECMPERQVMEVERVTKHEDYINDKETGQVINDIALIRLKQPAIFNEAVQPICLPLNEEQTAEDIGIANLQDGMVGKQATVIGWGKTETFQRKFQKILQKVNIPIVSNEHCRAQLSELKQNDTIITPSHVCAGEENSDKDSCKGDSGGPILMGKDAENPTIYQIGIVSFGLSRHCGIGFAGVYSRITEFMPWIKKNIHA